MLVLTGLAGRIHTSILTTKERHTLVTELKSSKNDFLNSVEGLSTRQLNFKIGKNGLSLKDCVYKLISIENNLWMATKASLKQETTSVKKTMPDDEALYSFAQQKNFQCNELKFENIEKALKFYKDQRNEMLRYVHTSTENVRAHVGKTCIGNFDAYQLILLNTFFSKYYTQQIEKLKTDPNFPK
jgi:hypothetical protein